MANLLKGHMVLSEEAKRNSLNNWPGGDINVNPALTEDYIWNNLKNLYINCLEPLMNAFGETNIKITSAYRSIPVNKAVGGSDSSQHVYGLAADVVCLNKSTSDLWNWLYFNLENGWSQLIWEYPERGNYGSQQQVGYGETIGADSSDNSQFSWVHISWAEGYNKNKTTIATAREDVINHYLNTDYNTYRSTKKPDYVHNIKEADNSLFVSENNSY